MKTRLNITIEEGLISKMKYYAQKHHTSVSELVESYFKILAKPIGRKNIIEMVDSLSKPAIDDHSDLTDLYYKEQGRKYDI